MNKRLAVLLLMASCGVAQAAPEVSNEAESYIVGLCAMTSEQKATDQSQDQYVQKLKDMAKRGNSPYAIDKPEFNEDEAEKVAAAYMKLPEAVKEKNRHDADACKKATMAQYQKAE